MPKDDHLALTQPTPNPLASVSIEKGLEKSGSANTGELHKAVLRAANDLS
jgi:hypothetical protein